MEVSSACDSTLRMWYAFGLGTGLCSVDKMTSVLYFSKLLQLLVTTVATL